MKKITCLALTVLLCLSVLSVSAFAATPALTDGEGSQKINVEATSTITDDPTAIYGVTVEWASMSFVYSGTQQWNPAAHDYTGATSGSWDRTTATVTVTNDSNATLNVAGSAAKLPAYATGVLADVSLTLTGITSTPEALAAWDGATSTDDVKIGTLTLTGEPTGELGATKIGEITLTFSKPVA